MYAFDLKTKQRTPVTMDMVGGIDGIEPDGRGGLLITDVIGARLLHVAASGQTRVLAKFSSGGADFGYIGSKQIAIVPFHSWVPDVYQGAPTNVTGFMAAATKTAAFAALLRFLVGAFGPRVEDWVPLITVLAILTMSVANLVALAQTNVKRLLAFSSIAHAGYLMIALTCELQAWR